MSIIIIKNSLAPMHFLVRSPDILWIFWKQISIREDSPKRSVQFRNGKLNVGIKLKKYPKFNALIWKAINESFDNNIIKSIKKNSFVTKIPDVLLDLINKQIANIEERQIEEIIAIISVDIATSVSKHKK